MRGECECLRMQGEIHRALKDFDNASACYNGAQNVAVDKLQEGEVLVNMATLAAQRQVRLVLGSWGNTVRGRGWE